MGAQPTNCPTFYKHIILLEKHKVISQIRNLSVSFDVEYLFTKVLIADFLDINKNLFNSNKLHSTKFIVAYFRFIYFIFQDVFYNFPSSL